MWPGFRPRDSGRGGPVPITDLVGKVEERRSTPKDIEGLPLFLVNAVRGVVPVATLDGVKVPPGRETDALARRFWP